MHVLAIGCHPDDIEIGCGGTLAKLSKMGHQVAMCHVASGDKGHMIIPPEELSIIRDKEARNAGELIGAQVVNLAIPDLEVNSNSEQLILAMVEVIREVRPDYIITHAPNDYMKDHMEVTKAVFDASFTASVPRFTTNKAHISHIPPIYYMDTLAGVGFLPTEYVDISTTIELKLQMINCHQSQVKWLKEHDGIDFLDSVRTISKFRGLQSDVAFAEGFTQCQAWHRLTTQRLLP